MDNQHCPLKGSKIVSIREMTRKEAEIEGWVDYIGKKQGNGCRVIVLDNGVKLFASQDYEANGPGALFFHDKDSKQYAV